MQIMLFTNFKRKKAEICKFCGRLGSKNLQFKNLSLMGKQILRMVSKLVVRNDFQSPCTIPKVYIPSVFLWGRALSIPWNWLPIPGSTLLYMHHLLCPLFHHLVVTFPHPGSDKAITRWWKVHIVYDT